MTDLRGALARVDNDVKDVNEWAESEYNKYFAQYFKGEVDLYNRMKSKKDPITDQELEWILTDLPLELFSVTEQLSKLRITEEVIKLSIKKREREYVHSYSEGSETKRKVEAAALTADDRLLVTVYDEIAERVTRQMTFSKELIMSAKKIWDARRADGILVTDVNTTKEPELPEY